MVNNEYPLRKQNLGKMINIGVNQMRSTIQPTDGGGGLLPTINFEE